MTVRLRYAPSPTGDPHVGNIRTALWSWLHARRLGGAFVLRLEDTDQSRAVEGSLQRIEDSLRWLGMEWDEGPDEGGPYGPYVQSERLERYHEATDRLLAADDAYRCFCTPDDLRQMREQQRASGQPPGYAGRCRGLDPDEAASRAAAGESCVVRFKMPLEGSTTFEDMIRGPITYENRVLDDFVMLKSDRFPTYHLAHVVDDHAMEITHVTRGDEWIPSTPRHVRLFEALGYEPPVFVHTPVILGPDGGKLSKRHGAKSVLDYADEGYLPEALCNFLAIIGWAPDGSTEILSQGELIESFDLARLNPAPATFDTEKLEWMNGVYMRSLSLGDLAGRFAQRLDDDLPAEVARPLDAGLVDAFTPLIQERVRLLSEVAPMTDFFFTDDVEVAEPGEFIARGMRKTPERAAPALEAAVAALEPLADDWRAEPIEAALRALAEELGLRAGDLFMLCRVAVTGKRVTPPLFETMEIVGAAPSLARMRAAVPVLAEAYPSDAPDGVEGGAGGDSGS
ncbi:MAG: glutamate--tRNA ligase [Chloroflexota bacterium]|nr:glutamate--tRNA ligase [Chloroflexota bacterium]